MTTALNSTVIRDKMTAFWGEVSKVLVGCHGSIEVINWALIARGHCLLEGVPGTGKTLLGLAMGRALNCKSNIFTLTADLMPGEVGGTEVYDPVNNKMTAMFGKIDPNNPFTLADEINRAPEKTLGALLEPMQNHVIRIGREMYPIREPFFVIGVRNPIEQGGTYKMPEAVLDRFAAMSVIGYTSFDQAVKLALMREQHYVDPLAAAGLKPVLEPEELVAFQDYCRDQVELPHSVAQYIARLVYATRPPEEDGATDDPFGGELYKRFMPEVVNVSASRQCRIKDENVIMVGASNRAILWLTALARACAVMQGDNVVTDYHVKKVAISVLAHRLTPNEQKVHRYPRHLMRLIIKAMIEQVPTA